MMPQVNLKMSTRKSPLFGTGELIQLDYIWMHRIGIDPYSMRKKVNNSLVIVAVRDRYNISEKRGGGGNC